MLFKPEKSARRTIPYRIVFSRASTGFRPEVEKVVEQALEQAGLPRLKTPVFERTALQASELQPDCPPYSMIPRVGAARNISAVYAEVRDTLAHVTHSAVEVA